MKMRTFEVWGAALLMAGLALASAGIAPARADDESQNQPQRKMIRIERGDRDNSDPSGGYLGVQVQRLTSSLRRARNIPESVEGTLVSGVEDGSPADDAGIKRGDVILEVNHHDTESPSDLVETVRGLDPGDRASILVWRDGSRRNFSVTVGTRPEGGDVPAPPPMPRWEGRLPDNGSNGSDFSNLGPMMRRRADVDRQLSELQDQLSKLREEDARLEQELQQLRQDMERMQGKGRDRDQDNRDRDNDEGD